MVTSQKQPKLVTNLTEVDSDDVLIDIDVLDIPITSTKAGHKDGNHNVDEFFGETMSETGNDRKVC